MPLRTRSLYDKQGNVYFITTTVMNFDNIFIPGRNYNLILTDSLNHQLIEHKSQLFAYVIMPSHLHLVLYMPKGQSIIDFMRDFKRHTSLEIRKLAEKERRYYLLERLRSNAEFSKNQTHKVWMDRFDDLIITTERMMGIKVNYIHFNPVKAGLVEKPEDWEFSSARNYILDDYGLIKINTSWEIDD
jgi:REP element-mobilizing transposase RayT